MFKYFCIGFLMLIYSFTIYGQDGGLTDDERVEKGSQIIENARKEIGIDKLILNLVSLQLSIKSTTDVKQNNLLNLKELYILLPDKILSVTTTTKPFESKSTSIWNAEKYKKLSEFVSPDGKRSVRDVTDRNPMENLGKVVKDPAILEKFMKVVAVDPKERLNNDLWREVFPLILINPFLTKAEFKYIGKAKSADQEANVVDTMSENGHSIRLLFNTKTNQLISMTEKYKFSDGDYENNYYYSNREIVDKILIPKKIKVEHKFTATGKDTNVSYQYIDVIDFKINPKFKLNLFDLN